MGGTWRKRLRFTSKRKMPSDEDWKPDERGPPPTERPPDMPLGGRERAPRLPWGAHRSAAESRLPSEEPMYDDERTEGRPPIRVDHVESPPLWGARAGVNERPVEGKERGDICCEGKREKGRKKRGKGRKTCQNGISKEMIEGKCAYIGHAAHRQRAKRLFILAVRVELALDNVAGIHSASSTEH